MVNNIIIINYTLIIISKTINFLIEYKKYFFSFYIFKPWNLTVNYFKINVNDMVKVLLYL